MGRDENKSVQISVVVDLLCTCLVVGLLYTCVVVGLLDTCVVIVYCVPVWLLFIVY